MAPNYLCGGDIDMYIPLEKPNTYPCKLYATRTEMLGKAIWRLTIQENPSAAGAPPRPNWGAYSAPANPLSCGERLAAPSPRTPSPAIGPSPVASPTPTPNPKLVPTPLCGRKTYLVTRLRILTNSVAPPPPAVCCEVLKRAVEVGFKNVGF